MLGYAKAYFHLPYRQTEGIVKGHAGNRIPSIPDFSTISRRINRLDLKLENKNKTREDEYITITIDSSGIKKTNRGQWMNKKWNIQNRKGYLKIHVAVDIRSKKILSMEITDEHVHDNKVLPKLVNNISIDGFVVVDRVLGDGAYMIVTLLSNIYQRMGLCHVSRSERTLGLDGRLPIFLGICLL